MTDLSSLAAYRKGDSAPIEREVPAITFTGALVAFDQSMANTGWAKVVVAGERFIVQETGNLRTERGPVKGMEDTLTRVVLIHHQALQVLARTKPTLVVHESPPVGGRLPGGNESSLASAVGVRIAASTSGIPVHMVHRQRGATLLTGKPSAKKPAVAAALRQVLNLEGIKPLNEAIYDALSIAWAAVREVNNREGHHGQDV